MDQKDKLAAATIIAATITADASSNHKARCARFAVAPLVGRAACATVATPANPKSLTSARGRSKQLT
jgi:hypothetical protein